jgi:hypothetical protein
MYLETQYGLDFTLRIFHNSFISMYHTPELMFPSPIGSLELHRTRGKENVISQDLIYIKNKNPTLFF